MANCSQINNTTIKGTSAVSYDSTPLPCTDVNTCDGLNVILAKFDNIICSATDSVNTLIEEVTNITEDLMIITDEIESINNQLLICCPICEFTGTANELPVCNFTGEADQLPDPTTTTTTSSSTSTSTSTTTSTSTSTSTSTTTSTTTVAPTTTSTTTIVASIVIGTASCRSAGNCQDNAICGVHLPVTVYGAPVGYYIQMTTYFPNDASVTLFSNTELYYTENNASGSIMVKLDLYDFFGGTIIATTTQTISHQTYWGASYGFPSC